MLTAMASSRPDPIFAVVTFLESCIGRVHDGELKKVSTNVHFNIDNVSLKTKRARTWDLCEHNNPAGVFDGRVTFRVK